MPTMKTAGLTNGVTSGVAKFTREDMTMDGKLEIWVGSAEYVWLDKEMTRQFLEFIEKEVLK